MKSIGYMAQFQNHMISTIILDGILMLIYADATLNVQNLSDGRVKIMSKLFPKPLYLTKTERSELEELIKKHSTPQQIALRARIILPADELVITSTAVVTGKWDGTTKAKRSIHLVLTNTKIDSMRYWKEAVALYLSIT